MGVGETQNQHPSRLQLTETVVELLPAVVNEMRRDIGLLLCRLAVFGRLGPLGLILPEVVPDLVVAGHVPKRGVFQRLALVILPFGRGPTQLLGLLTPPYEVPSPEITFQNTG